jgi:hypothetical protein
MIRASFRSSAAISKFESYAWSFRGEIIGRRPMIENPESRHHCRRLLDSGFACELASNFDPGQGRHNPLSGMQLLHEGRGHDGMAINHSEKQRFQI